MAKKRIATFLGPNEGLTIAGSHCYAYSGLLSVDTSEYEIFNFTTGNYYTVGKFTCNGAVRISLVDVGSITVFQLKLNGSNTVGVKVDTNDKDMPAQGFLEVLLPPNTEVILSANSSESTTAEKISASYTGRIYDA